MGGNRIPNNCIKRAHCILDDDNMIDLGHYGPHFTWMNKQSGQRLIKDRLDQAISNKHQNTLFPKVSMKNRIMQDFDHNCIILDTLPLFEFCPKPF